MPPPKMTYCGPSAGQIVHHGRCRESSLTADFGDAEGDGAGDGAGVDEAVAMPASSASKVETTASSVLKVETFPLLDKLPAARRDAHRARGLSGARHVVGCHWRPCSGPTGSAAASRTSSLSPTCGGRTTKSSAGWCVASAEHMPRKTLQESQASSTTGPSAARTVSWRCSRLTSVACARTTRFPTVGLCRRATKTRSIARPAARRRRCGCSSHWPSPADAVRDVDSCLTHAKRTQPVHRAKGWRGFIACGPWTDGHESGLRVYVLATTTDSFKGSTCSSRDSRTSARRRTQWGHQESVGALHERLGQQAQHALGR
jgi:hypothetical protein